MENIKNWKLFYGVIIIMIMDIATSGSSQITKLYAKHITHCLPTVILRDRLWSLLHSSGNFKPARVKGRNRNVNLDLSTPKPFYQSLMSFQGKIQHATNSKRRKRNIVLISKEGNSPFYKRKITRLKLDKKNFFSK